MGTITDLFRLFDRFGEELYFVGGFVRDTLLSIPTSDIDLATSAIPEKTSEILRAGGFRIIPIGMDFGTVGTHVDVESGLAEVQITTYRCREVYDDGSRHPTVAFGDSLLEDLRRRDFTVNAMAMDSSGNIIDPLQGRRDLKEKILRTPRDTGETFREDPLRMLRAFRFACRLGMRLHESILKAITADHQEILSISRERWKLEMDQLLIHPCGHSLSPILNSMMITGILTDMIPELESVRDTSRQWHGNAHKNSLWDHTLDVVAKLPPDLCLRWAGLLHDIGKPESRTVDRVGKVHFYEHEKIGSIISTGIAERFKFSRKERACVTFLVRNHMRPALYSSKWSDGAVRKLRRESGRNLQRLLDLALADISSHSDSVSRQGLSGLKELRIRLSKPDIAHDSRVLPRELGKVLSGRIGTDIRSAPQVGIIINNLDELVRSGVLPPMAPPEFYIDYLNEHPEIRNSRC